MKGDTLRSRATATDVVESLQAVADAHGFQSTNLGEHRWVFTRTFRRRSTVVWGVLTLPVFGVGLVLLAQRRSESFTVVLAQRHDGTSVAIGGHVPETVAASIRDAVVGHEREISWLTADDLDMLDDFDDIVAANDIRPSPETIVRSPGLGHLPDPPVAVPNADGSGSPVVEPMHAGPPVVEPTIAGSPQVEPTIVGPPVVEPTIVVPPHVEPTIAAPPIVEPTVAGSELLPPTDPPAQPPAPEVPAGDTPEAALVVTWTVLFDTGEVVRLTSSLIVGRDPVAVDPDDLTISISDPERSVSGTHFALVLDQQRLMIEDRGSTNGTGVIRNHRLIELRLGDSLALERGDEIAFGARRARVTNR